MAMFWIIPFLAQVPEADFSQPVLGPHGWLASTGISGILYVGFLIWMLWYCWNHDPDRNIWLWVMIIFQGVGPAVYFFVRFLPTVRGGEAPWGKWLKRRRNLTQLESAAAQIGNPHHHIQLADALRELGRDAQAREHFALALAREPENLAALWGAAQVDFRMLEFAAAREKLAQVLGKDPQYKFGDVSLLFAKSLQQLGETAAARQHLTGHVRRWRQPEAMYLLAGLCRDEGDVTAARKYLSELIVDVNSSPRAIARKQVFWKSRARKLLQQLGK